MATKKIRVPSVVVALHIAKMTPAEKVTFQRATANTAKASSAYTGSPAAQSSMAAWQKASDALDANSQAITAAEKTLETVRGQAAALVHNFDLAAADYAATVRTLAASDVTVVSALGLTTGAQATHVTSIAAPTGLRVGTTKAGLDYVEWAKVAGALLYCAEISVDPATGTSFTMLAGGGRKRKLSNLGLVHGQSYLIRVRALGANLIGPWSPNLSYVGK
jgi:hypothetical protein